MKTAGEWKAHYALERAQLGTEGLERLLERAPGVDLPERGAIVFPHTRLLVSGELPAAAALACVRSGREVVPALGVLHGARAADREIVARARSGDERARAELRRVHGPGAPLDEGRTSEEFSLDGFAALLEAAARREGRPLPRLVRRFPFLTGDRPADLPGLDELRELVSRGAALVATADPIHHGAGYGTPELEQLAREDPKTIASARASVERGLELLAKRDFALFLEHAARERSDFRDAGPVLATLLEGPLEASVLELVLVDYAPTLGASEPTWVAGALATVATS